MRTPDITPPQLILKADDYGNMEAANTAVCNLVKEGLLTNVGVMVTFTKASHVAELQQAIDASPDPSLVGVVLHVNFQSGKPAYQAKETTTLVDENGNFKRPEPTHFAWEEYASQIDAQEAEREIRAQIALFQQLFGRVPDALDSHNIILAIEPVADVAIKIAKEFGIPITYPYLYSPLYNGALADRVLHTNLRERYRENAIPCADNAYAVYFHAKKNPSGSMLAAIDALKPGVTEMVFHPVDPIFPGMSTDTAKRYAARVVDYQLLTDSDVQAEIHELRRRGQLTSYRQLRRDAFTQGQVA